MLGLAAFAAIFIFTYQAYKAANEYGRNAPLWAGLMFCVGFGLQVVFPLLVGIIVGLVLAMGGASAAEIQTVLNGYGLVLTLLFVVSSIVGMYLILRYLGTVPEDDIDNTTPPPPSDFNIG